MSTTLPVSIVVLYSSGVAYLEHAGAVSGNASVELAFKASQINDVLKSLVLQDLGGGKIGSVVYPSHDPISKTLKSFQVDLTENPALPALLTQLRGATLAIQLATETLTGTIVGLEKRPKALDRGSIEIWVLNLLVQGAIRTLPLENISALTLQDPQLQKDLSSALSVVAQARDQDKKPVTLNFLGAGERQVRVGYVVEAPIWKSSYRLILPAEDSSATAHIQGWAIIENQTDNDWPAISLTLVSGRPISFIQELYQPIYLTRPTVQPNLFTSLRPQIYGAGNSPLAAAGGGGSPGGMMAQSRGSSATLARRKASPSKMVAVASAPGEYEMRELDLDATTSVTAEALATELGELFQFTVHNISLPRQRSAMIPIVTDPIAIERLSIYNESVLASNPLYGIRLTNNTGKHLLQGPVTVLEASAYAGDARIDNLPPNQHRYLSYGIDLQVIVTTTQYGGRAQIQTAAISRGILEIAEKFMTTREYVVDNKAARPRAILIEHPIEPGYSLISKPDPVESTSTHHRLRYDIPTGEARTIGIQSQSVRTRRLALVDELAASLEKLIRSDGVPVSVKSGLESIIQRRRELNDLDHRITLIEKQIAELTKEQSRIRDNLKTSPDSSQYHNRLLSKLNEQESAFEKLRIELENLRESRETTGKKLADHISELDIT